MSVRHEGVPMGTLWVPQTLGLAPPAPAAGRTRPEDEPQHLHRPGLTVEPGDVERGREALPGDRLGPGELPQPVLAVDPAEAGVADAAEGQRRAPPANVSTELTAVMPLRIRRAISIAAGALANTRRPGRSAVALASSTRLLHVGHPGDGQRRAEGLLAHRRRSPRARRPAPSGARTAGRTASAPPTTARPPRASASSMCRRMTSSCAGIVIGPYVASSSEPGRSVAGLLGQLGDELVVDRVVA